jgi:hypothetical protein
MNSNTSESPGRCALSIYLMQHTMSLFRKVISMLPLLCVFSLCEGQPLGDFDVRRGVDPFFLGSIRTQQDSSIRLAEGGKFEYKGRTEYSYLYPAAFNNPCFLGGVYFKNIILTYVSDTLIRVMLNSIYTPNLYPDFDKRAKQEFRELCKFLKEQWKSSGKKKTFLQSPDNRIISNGLQWKTDGKSMKAALYEDKSKAHRLYDISITLELPGYD